MILNLLYGGEALNANKAKEKIIRKIAKKNYINKVKDCINNAIVNYKFGCDIKIDESDDIDIDIHTTLICIIKWLDYYGYDSCIKELNRNSGIIKVNWG